MTIQDDLLSSLVRAFPKGIKVNKTVSVTPEVIDNFHNVLREKAEENNFKYYDIINELKIVNDNVSTTVKIALYRNAKLLSAESEDNAKAKKMIENLEKMIKEL